MREILKNRLLATTLVLAGLAMAGGDARAIMIRETNLVVRSTDLLAALPARTAAG